MFEKIKHYIGLHRKFWQWALLIFLAFLWGTSPILVKRGLESFSFTQVAAMRIFIAFIVSIPLIIRRRKYFRVEYLPSLFIVGFLGTALPAFLFTKAQTEITSALAGMLNSLVPFFALIIGLILYNDRTKWHNIIGVLIGLVGAIGLILKDANMAVFQGNNWYGLLIVAATICYALNANEIRHNLRWLDGITIAVFGFMLVGPFAGIFLLFTDFSQAVATPDFGINLLYVIILAVFSSVVAVVGHTFLIQYTSTLFATSTSYVIPVFAILWGIYDGETITLLQIVWISVILFGIYLVNKQDKPKFGQKSK